MIPKVICFLAILAASAFSQSSGTMTSGEHVSQAQVPADRTVTASVPAMPSSGEKHTYGGTLRVFVTEITGRWNDCFGNPFPNAFLSFALQEDFALSDRDSIVWQLEWNGNDHFDLNGDPYEDIEENNIKVIAAVFDSNSYTGYSDPPTGHPFDVHEVDATAAAECGGTGYNLITSDFTHSVFVQDAVTHG